MKLKLYRFEVESYDLDAQVWQELGSILLPDLADYRSLEHALAALGLYAPRGMDQVDWLPASDVPACIIRDCSGAMIVRMFASGSRMMEEARR